MIDTIRTALRFGTILAGAVLAAICARGEEQDELALRELVIRDMISVYDTMEPQFDDPVGRRYCLMFDRSLEADGGPAPSSFVRRFQDHPEVRPRKWCRWHKGRILSAGPVEWLGADEAKVWSFSWVASRPGGSDCLRRARRKTAGWRLTGECEQGSIYN